MKLSLLKRSFIYCRGVFSRPLLSFDAARNKINKQLQIYICNYLFILLRLYVILCFYVFFCSLFQILQFFAITLWTQTILSFLCATFHDLFDILNIMRSHAFHFIICLLTNFIFSETWLNHLLSYILLLLVWSYLSNLLIYCIC